MLSLKIPLMQTLIYLIVLTILCQSENLDNVWLLGDFNARTATVNELINSDRYNFDVYDDEVKVSQPIDNEDLRI